MTINKRILFEISIAISFGLLFGATNSSGVNAQTNQTDIIIEKTNPPSTNDFKLRNIAETSLLNITEDDLNQAKQSKTKQIISKVQNLTDTIEGNFQ